MKFSQWLPAIVWMAVIYAFSNQAHSGALTETYLHGANVIVRKLAHMAEYALLAVLYRRPLPADIPAFFLAVLYAASDEWHQSFVPGRSACPSDVMVDAAGALLGLWLIRLKKKS